MKQALWAGLIAAGLGVGLRAQAGQPNAGYLSALAVKPALPAIHYSVDLTHPANHLAQVTMVIPTPHAATRIEMPAWYPGRYSIYNFAANVQQPAAFCQPGSGPSPNDPPLAFRRLGPNAWEVRNGACRQVRWQYRVYGNVPLNGSFFQLDEAHADLNGGPVYMYAAGDKPNPVVLDVHAPAGWRVLDQLGQLNQTRLWFPNYDIFIDAPLEAGPDFTLDQFQVDGKTYRVMIHDFVTPSSNAANRKALLVALAKIAAAENRIVGADELDTYTFFFHFEPQSEDGMEHLFGTQIMVPAGLGTPEGLQGAESTAAHEFFHQWNVKRIRPVALGPFNYEAPNPTPSLWVAEGFTQYYGDITQARVGLEPKRDYLNMLAGSMGGSLVEPGYRLTSPEVSSLTAWFHDATPILQETNRSITVISYYLRGEQIAAVLDLDIRRRTRGQRSLNDVMRWLWQNTYHAPRTSYYLPGRGYTDLDVEHAIEAVAGVSYAGFFKQFISGAGLIPYNDYLSAAGLQLRCVPAAGSANYTGIDMGGDTVRGIDPGSPGAAAGFGRDEVVKSVNGQPAAKSAIGKLPPGRPATVVTLEHGVTEILRLTPAPPRATACTMEKLPQATAAERALRAAWLKP